MGIYGALSTAVSGMRAQAQALENISGNIANSQTTAYKRIETDFVDMIADAPVKRQVAGAVMAQSRATNSEKGDIKGVTNETFIALSSDGFFMVEPAAGKAADGSPAFTGATLYTRRGDFEIDKDGLLVNGAGYYLKGLMVDPATGAVSGGVPGVIKLSNGFLPAQQTTQIGYEVNLPDTAKALDTVDFADAAAATGAIGLDGTDNMNTIVNLPGGAVELKAGGGNIVRFEFYDGGTFTPSATPGVTIVGVDIGAATDPKTINIVLADMQAKFRAAGGASAASATIGLQDGELRVSLGDAKAATDTLIVSATTAGMALPLTTTSPETPQAQLATIPANQNTLFEKNSQFGGTLPVYSPNGGIGSLTLRWAKVDSSTGGGDDTWNLYYMSDSKATGDAAMWTRIDQDYTFDGTGMMTPDVTATPLNNLRVDGIDIGNVSLNFGPGGVRQQNADGSEIEVGNLTQNGYGSGKYQSTSITDNGRVVASYDNGMSVDVAQVVTAQFKAVNQLKRMDGGVYAATTESGEPLIEQSGEGIVGSSLESSNTDISDEFTKLIITQQAYSAGTKIISSANDMLQEALNMIR